MSGNKIIWVDDDNDLIRPQSSSLLDCGYLVDVVPDVDAAIAMIKSSYPELIGIILDVMMNPGKELRDEQHMGGLVTGLVLYRYLNQKNLCPPLKAFVFSHRHDPKARTNLQKMGVNYYQKQHYKGRAICDLVKQEFGVPQLS